MWWSNVQRKAQFPQAYHCSISSSVLPEIDGVRGWTKARDWKAINCFFAEDGDITIRPRRLAGTTSWAELHLFLWQAEGGGGGGAGAWHRISINSGAGNVSLSLFLSPSHIAPCLSHSLFFSSGFCLSLLLCAILIPLSASSYLDFLLTGILSTTLLYSLLCHYIASFFHCPSVTPGDVDRLGK